MENHPIITEDKITTRALFISEHINFHSLETTGQLANNPLTLRVRGEGVAVLFRYGVVVLFNVPAMEEAVFIDNLKSFIPQPFDKPESEEIELRIRKHEKEGMEKDTINVKEFSIKRIQLIAEILSKHVILTYYETKVSGTFDSIEPLALRLQQSGKTGLSVRDLLKHIGNTFLGLHKMVGRVEVNEKPEVLWENPELERLYALLEDEYEISERQLALERKLDLISRTAETALNLVQTRRGLRLEWYIVILIIVEIILSLYELFLHPRL